MSTSSTVRKMRLRREVKVKWLEALRSGRYNQGKAYLSFQDGNGGRMHCCLGVLCELAAEEGVVTPRDDHDIRSYDGADSMPPVAVRRWAAEESDRPVDTWCVDHVETYEDGSTRYAWTHLATLNDDENYTFAQIADVIEEQL